MALIFTSSRTAWGSLLLSIFILLVLTMRMRAGKTLLLFIGIGALSTVFFFGNQISSRLETARTDRTRQELATMAYNIIDHFPLGIGENNYDQVMSDKYAHPNWVGHTHLPAHNKFLLVWAETGPQGLAAFLLIIAAATWQGLHGLIRNHSNDPRLFILMACLLSAFIGYIFHMQTEDFQPAPISNSCG